MPEPDLQFLNAAGDEQATQWLQRCCGSSRWVAQMVERRPYSSIDELQGWALAASEELARADWLEAFTHHPRIGDREVLRAKFADTDTSWEGGEQGGVAGAGDDVLDALEAGNREYEERFGFVFLVCATGKRADEMLELLQARLHNDPTEELANTSNEQRKITALRIDKLIAEHQPQEARTK